MLDFRKRLINGALHNVLKRLRCPPEVMFTCVRRYAAYPLSLQHNGEMMQERGIFEDHSTVHRWALKMLPVLAAVFGPRKRPCWPALADGRDLYQDRTQMEISLRAVDRMGDTVDFFLAARQILAAARRFLESVIDESGANTVAIPGVKADACVDT